MIKIRIGIIILVSTFFLKKTNQNNMVVRENAPVLNERVEDRDQGNYQMFNKHW